MRSAMCIVRKNYNTFFLKTCPKKKKKKVKTVTKENTQDNYR